jgi:hypothetical protein
MTSIFNPIEMLSDFICDLNQSDHKILSYSLLSTVLPAFLSIEVLPEPYHAQKVARRLLKMGLF